MSIQSIAWVFDQDIRPSSIKFVLLALADCAGGGRAENVVWPSITAICQKTSQDRKTVIDALNTLEKMRLLEDTGDRCGATKQVKVYRILGLPSGESHYTYQLINPDSGEFYIGVRSCHGNPLNDSSYMGSGKWPQSQRGLEKEILAVFETREEASADEVMRIRSEGENPFCMNVKGKGYQKRYSSASPLEQSRISPQTIPKTGHGTSIEPSITVSERGLAFSDWFKGTLSEGVKLTQNWRENWAKIFDDLIRFDSRKPEQIHAVCKWAREDRFWRNNFLSPKKLRERDPQGILYFDKFNEQQRNGKNNPASTSNRNVGHNAGLDYSNRPKKTPSAEPGATA